MIRQHHELTASVGRIVPAGSQSLILELLHPAQRRCRRHGRSGAEVGHRHPELAKGCSVKLEQHIPSWVSEEISAKETVALPAKPENAADILLGNRMIDLARGQRGQ